MKKLLTLALAVLMCVFAISAMADTVSIDRTLELQFVPSKDADVIITGTKNLPELLKAALLEQGYDVKDINITVGTNYEATGEAMAAGTVDLGWLPGGTYALFSDDVDVILTATRAGLSNDSEDPKTWNGEANKTLKNGPQVTFYRSLIYATPSAYGKELAAKVNAGEALTWDDLQGQLGRAEEFLFRRLHLPDPLAAGSLRQEDHRSAERHHAGRLWRCVRSGCRRGG